MSELTANQFDLLLKVKKLIDDGAHLVTRDTLFAADAGKTFRNTRDIAVLLRQLAYKGLVVSRMGIPRGTPNGYVLTQQGRDVIADPSKIKSKGRKTRRHFAICGECGQMAEVWLHGKMYKCDTCLNQEEHTPTIEDFIWRRDDADYTVATTRKRHSGC